MQKAQVINDSLVSIPRFNLQESLDVEMVFRDHQIEYEKRGVIVSANVAGGYQEYVFDVPQSCFSEAIELLMDLFGIGDNSRLFSGRCPACGTSLAGVVECTFCDLTLGSDYREALSDHPFMIFLVESKLIDLSGSNGLFASQVGISNENPISWLERAAQGILAFLVCMICVSWVYNIFDFRPVLDGLNSWLVLMGAPASGLLIIFKMAIRKFGHTKNSIMTTSI